MGKLIASSEALYGGPSGLCPRCAAPLIGSLAVGGKGYRVCGVEQVGWGPEGEAKGIRELLRS